MKSVTQLAYTDEQIYTWLRGLLTIAWADGDFSPEEKELIAQITKNDLIPDDRLNSLSTIEPEELAAVLGEDKNIAENFLRTGVLVAIADGVYSAPEAELLYKFSDALGLELEALKSLEHTLCEPDKNKIEEGLGVKESLVSPPSPHPDLLHPVKDWLDKMEIHDPRLAKFICKMVPSQCPFERDVKLFGRQIVHIPPLCKLNPLYEQLVGLRFRSLSYLADDCQEDISEYI
ncbi:MAG: Mo-dependent nitrogenase C-terminal domain-containing protein [Prochloraceae cyanobacterium]|nr:Mo-dependent nitrogenase C-terminal domain-containing protein [Prochloraceae cyanobacterium]